MHEPPMLSERLAWVGAHVRVVGQPEIVRDRTWATTARIRTTDGPVWLKECAPIHGFEPSLVAALANRWPQVLPRVVAHDAERRWLLLADAGTPFDELGNPPELWLRLLPRYAELQRGAAPTPGLPDRTLGRWPGLFDELLASPLPLDPGEARRLRALAPLVAQLCAELAAHGLPAAIQHDDLHHKNAFVDGDALRIIDWGDASYSHPFVSLVVTFRFLEERTGLAPGDAWFTRLRDAYLEPWGGDLAGAFELAQRLGRIAHCFGWAALRRQLPEGRRARFDAPFATVLRRALERFS